MKENVIICRRSPRIHWTLMKSVRYILESCNTNCCSCSSSFSLQTLKMFQEVHYSFQRVWELPAAKHSAGFQCECVAIKHAAAGNNRRKEFNSNKHSSPKSSRNADQFKPEQSDFNSFTSLQLHIINTKQMEICFTSESNSHGCLSNKRQFPSYSTESDEHLFWDHKLTAALESDCLSGNKAAVKLHFWMQSHIILL